jgi:cobyrinic acid a,c-diamide synthase
MMESRPAGHGYVTGEVTEATPVLPKGTTLKGHEFHNSRAVIERPISTGYRLSRGQGLGGGVDGIIWRNVLASYTHLHAVGCPEWAPGMIHMARHQAV